MNSLLKVTQLVRDRAGIQIQAHWLPHSQTPQLPTTDPSVSLITCLCILFPSFHPLSSFHQVMDPSTHLLTQLSAIPPSICAAPVGHYPATRFFALTTEATMVAKVLLSCISESDWKD